MAATGSSVDHDEKEATHSNIIKLNIGGTLFQTTQNTLDKCGYFQTLTVYDKTQEDGSYFIDRNAEYFKYLLDYLRYGCVVVPTKLLSMIVIEAQFYQIELNVDAIQRKLSLSELMIVGDYYDVAGDVRINGIALNKVYRAYQVEPARLNKPWDEIGCWSEWFVPHLVQQFGYTVTQIAHDGNSHNLIVYLKPAVPESVLISADAGQSEMKSVDVTVDESNKDKQDVPPAYADFAVSASVQN